MEAALSLGSNLGDRLSHLRAARDLIGEHPSISLLQQSSLFETEPVDVDRAHESLTFMNVVIMVTTDLPPLEVLDALKTIEASVGRTPGVETNAPREVDVDIIYMDQLEFEDERLSIPHPRWSKRRFVVEPLAELRGDVIIEPNRPCVSDVLADLPAKPQVRRVAEIW